MRIQGAYITGVAGFIGSNLAIELLRQGIPVTGSDNFSSGDRKNITEIQALFRDFHFVEADVCDAWSGQLVHPVTHIFHLASLASPKYFVSHGLEIMMANSQGTLRALEFAEHCGARLVFSSTSEIYGHPAELPMKESSLAQLRLPTERSSYVESKRFAEALIYNWNLKHRAHGTKHGVVRLFNSYGPRMSLEDGRVMAAFFKAMQEKSPLPIHGSGAQTRSFCFVEDTVRGIIKYAISELSEAINLGAVEEIEIIELAKKFQNIFSDPSSGVRHLPIDQEEPRRRKPSVDGSLKNLEWESKINLEQGLRISKTWFEDHP